jgi:hypothetical protein
VARKVFRTVHGTVGTIDSTRRCPRCGGVTSVASRESRAPDPPPGLNERIRQRRRETPQERADRLTGFFSPTRPSIPSATDVRRVAPGDAPKPPDLAGALAAARSTRS